MSGAPDIDVSCHIQPTTITDNEICNDTSLKRPSDKSDDANIPTPSPNGSGDCLEKNDASGDSLLNPEFRANLTVQAVRDAASPNLKFYIDNIREPGSPRLWSDIEQAVLLRLPELGVNPSAYQAAQDHMGLLEALLSMVIIDRNMDHPTSPIRSAGGALRAFTSRAAAGDLHLERSLFGIWGRSDGSVN